MTDWKQVAEQDTGLQIEEQANRKAHEDSSAALARHRYEYTIAVGVSFKEYARRCHLDPRTVARYAKAHQKRISGPPMSTSDALVHVSTSEAQALVIGVVAEARSVSMRTAQQKYGAEIRKIRKAAEKLAEERDTSVKLEAQNLARLEVEAERLREQEREELNADLDRARVEADSCLRNIRKQYRRFLEIDAVFTSEDVEALTRMLNIVRDLQSMSYLKLLGTTDVDWDAELAKIEDL